MTLSKKELEFNSWSRPFKNSPTLKNAKKKKKNVVCSFFNNMFPNKFKRCKLLVRILWSV